MVIDCGRRENADFFKIKSVDRSHQEMITSGWEQQIFTDGCLCFL